MKYKSDYNSTELKTKLNDLIEKLSEDKFSSHCQNVISRQTDTISGKIKGNAFVIWHYNHFWSGMIYSVIIGKITDNEIELRTKLNSFGLVLYSIISCVLGYAILIGMVIQDNNSFRFVVLRLLAGITFYLLMFAGMYIPYYSSKKETVEMLTEKLKLRKNVC